MILNWFMVTAHLRVSGSEVQSLTILGKKDFANTVVLDVMSLYFAGGTGMCFAGELSSIIFCWYGE